MTPAQITECTDEKPKCKVNGFLGRQGKQVAMCGYISVGDKSICCAKADFKCEHKAALLSVIGGDYE